MERLPKTRRTRLVTCEQHILALTPTESPPRATVIRIGSDLHASLYSNVLARWITMSIPARGEGRASLLKSAPCHDGTFEAVHHRNKKLACRGDFDDF